MHSLRVAAQRGCLIDDEVAQACPGNGLKGDLPAEVGRERDRCRLDRLGNLAGDERVAALGLALDGELKRNFLGERALKPRRTVLLNTGLRAPPFATSNSGWLPPIWCSHSLRANNTALSPVSCFIV
jgi:hypothetical protein